MSWLPLSRRAAIAAALSLPAVRRVEGHAEADQGRFPLAGKHTTATMGELHPCAFA